MPAVAGRSGIGPLKKILGDQVSRRMAHPVGSFPVRAPAGLANARGRRSHQFFVAESFEETLETEPIAESQFTFKPFEPTSQASP